MELTVQRGAIPVDLDRQRILYFDHAATWLLIQKYGPRFLLELYRVKDPKSFRFELVSMESLAFFLWAGLQRDAKQRGEELTLDQVSEFLHPWSYEKIFERVVYAAVGATATPGMLAASQGKEAAGDAAAKPSAGRKAAPASPGPTRVTTSLKRSGSPSRSSTGLRKSSGRQRRAS